MTRTRHALARKLTHFASPARGDVARTQSRNRHDRHAEGTGLSRAPAAGPTQGDESSCGDNGGAERRTSQPAGANETARSRQIGFAHAGIAFVPRRQLAISRAANRRRAARPVREPGFARRPVPASTEAAAAGWSAPARLLGTDDAAREGHLALERADVDAGGRSSLLATSTSGSGVLLEPRGGLGARLAVSGSPSATRTSWSAPPSAARAAGDPRPVPQSSTGVPAGRRAGEQRAVGGLVQGGGALGVGQGGGDPQSVRAAAELRVRSRR